ncbi:hypothetical protein BFG57_15170 [Bacillus solimangrovi]|uniref:Rhodanese domain-containing protein n=2 Tax=Bacillus solimangrovi TaxID=1305675 RepID=A0A1E5LEN6_9BACI|nr:hypothetical protein BFG57_15170 [Bacillus solimangrovi]
MEIQTDLIVDAKGLACPMPIVKTKKGMNELQAGQVMEVHATDKGSTADIKAWAESGGHQYIGTVEADGVLKHFLRRASGEENGEKKHPHVVSNDELQSILQNNEEMVLLDVREQAEYAFNHIPNAKSFPLENFEKNVTELNPAHTFYIICRTGNRSDVVAQKLTEAGFVHVFNVVPGMSEWTGTTAGLE